MVDMSSGQPKTNPASGREEDLNLGPPDYKSSTLTTRPRHLSSIQARSFHFVKEPVLDQARDVIV